MWQLIDEEIGLEVDNLRWNNNGAMAKSAKNEEYFVNEKICHWSILILEV